MSNPKTNIESKLAEHYGGDKDFWVKWLDSRIGNENPENDAADWIRIMKKARDIIEKCGLAGYQRWYNECRKTGGGYVELHGPQKEPKIETHFVISPVKNEVDK